MKTIIKLFLLIAQPLYYCTVAVAQKEADGFDVLYSNMYHKNSKIYNDNEVMAVYVDSQQIVTLLRAFKSDYKVRTNSLFVSIHDLEGNQKTFRELLPPNPDDFLYFTYRYCNGLVRMKDGNYIFGGYKTGTNSKFPDKTLYSQYYCIFDPNGKIVKFIPSPADTNQTLPNDIAIDHLGNIISVTNNSYRNYDSMIKIIPDPTDTIFYFEVPYIEQGMRLVKINPNGDILWQKLIPETVFPMTNTSEYKDIHINNDGSKYILSANEMYNPYIMIIDSSGTLDKKIEVKQIGYHTDTLKKNHLVEYTGRDYHKIRCTIDKEDYIYYVVTEYVPTTTAAGHESNILHYGKMNMDGDTLWTQTFSLDKPTYWYINRIFINIADNGDVVITSNVFDYEANSKRRNKTMLIRADNNGKLKWYKELRSFDLDESQFSTTLTLYKDKIYVGGGINFREIPVIHSADSFRRSLNNKNIGWLIMVDSLGRRCEADSLYGEVVPPICSTRPTLLIDPFFVSNGLNILLYPNPTQATITIFVENYEELYPGTQAFLYDIQGRLLEQFDIKTAKQQLNMNNYPAGNYVIKLVHQNKNIYSGKISKY